jgi:hypothetical protein
VIIDETAFLKVYRSIYHKNEDFMALIDADLGAEYRSANSPNPSPGSIYRLIDPFI